MAPWMATPGPPSMAAEMDVDQGGVHGRGEPGPAVPQGGRAGSLFTPPMWAWTDGGMEVPELEGERETPVCPQSFNLVA